MLELFPQCSRVRPSGSRTRRGAAFRGGHERSQMREWSAATFKNGVGGRAARVRYALDNEALPTSDTRHPLTITPTNGRPRR